MTETPNAGSVRVERAVVPRQVDTKPVFTWEATVRFTTYHDLPNNVVEAAVIRAIGADPKPTVLSLVALVEHARDDR